MLINEGALICMFTVINGLHTTERICNVNLAVEKKLATSIKMLSVFTRKYVDADKDLLVAHIPMELSFLLKCFLDLDKENGMIAEVTGHRMRENGLVLL